MAKPEFTNDDTATLNPGAARRLLDAFLVDNDDLEALNARLARFNIFRVLGAEKVEIRHSNVLAWLLSPKESHGLGAHFLRRFLSRLLMENESLDIPFTPAQIELMKFDDVEVRREWHNIDILAHSPANRWCLVLENKIKSKEHSRQLERYVVAAQKEFPESSIVPVFLTLQGDDPSESGREAGYVTLAHGQILDLAERIVEQNESKVPEDAHVLLMHYFDMLRRLTMQDEELVTLCKTIYRTHRDAIDLIVQYGGSSQVLDVCEEAVPQLVDTGYLQRTVNRVWFLPTDMLPSQPAILSGWGFLKKRMPVWCWFSYRQKSGTMQVTMEVGPIADPELRIRLLEAIKQAGFKFWERGAFRKEAKFTRFLTKSQKLRKTEDGDPDDDPEYVRGVAQSLWKKAWSEGSGITDVLREFDWNV